MTIWNGFYQRLKFIFCHTPINIYVAGKTSIEPLNIFNYFESEIGASNDIRNRPSSFTNLCANHYTINAIKKLVGVMWIEHTWACSQNRCLSSRLHTEKTLKFWRDKVYRHHQGATLNMLKNVFLRKRTNDWTNTLLLLIYFYESIWTNKFQALVILSVLDFHFRNQKIKFVQ